MTFELHPHLSKKIFIADLPLCRVLLEDERHYPWLMLVPRKRGASRLIDLSTDEQLQLMQELDIVQNMMWTEFKPDQLNVAAIGNKTPQLHIHVIARFARDPAWPGTVWDHPLRCPYSHEERQQLINSLNEKLEAHARL